VRVLAIESATPLASCAVVDASGVLAEAVLRAPMRHLEWLVPAVDEMLRGLALGPDGIGGIAVSQGPGGFTGLRIGIATAVAWARARSTPVIGVGTLEALALAAGEGGLVLAVLDAHRGEVAAGLYRVPAGGAPECLLAPIVALPDAVARAAIAALEGRAGGRAVPGGGGDAEAVLVAGDALARYGPALLGGLAGRGVAARPHAHPRASAVGMLALPRLQAGVRDDPLDLRPVYGSRPVARAWQETPREGGNG